MSLRIPLMGTVLSLSELLSSSRVQSPSSASSIANVDLMPLRSLFLDGPEPPMVTMPDGGWWKPRDPSVPRFVVERLETKNWRRAGREPAMRPTAVSTLDQSGMLAMWSVARTCQRNWALATTGQLEHVGLTSKIIQGAVVVVDVGSPDHGGDGSARCPSANYSLYSQK